MNEKATRTSPFFDRLESLGSISVEAGGWKPTWYYESNQKLEANYDIPNHVDQTQEVGIEHQHVRNHVGMCDLSSMFPFEIAGPSASDFVQQLLSNDIDIQVGEVRYGLLLNEDGGILGDIIITPLEDDRYFAMAPTGFEYFDVVEERAPSDIVVRDLQDCYSTACVWGPQAEEVVQPLTEIDVSTSGFPYFSCQQIDIDGIPVIALRLSFVGESGWEFWTPSGYGTKLWDTLWKSGQNHDIAPLGYGAAISMSLEKDYRLMGWDIGPKYNPFEARMDHVVDLGTDFVGKQALVKALDEGIDRKLTCMTMDEEDVLPEVGSTVKDGEKIVSETIRSEYGYSIKENIVYSYLPIEYCEIGLTLSIQSDSDLHTATVQETPLFDPDNDRMRR